MQEIDMLLEKEKTIITSDRFSYKWMAGRILMRQQHEKDTIIIITGDRRQGKSTWGLKLLRYYIKLRKEQDPNFKWSWKENFPLSRTAAVDLATRLPRKSFIFYDEGGDQFYRQETNKKAQRDLIKFLNKSGIRLHLTIVIWPDPYTLDPKLLNMAQMMVMVPFRAENYCSFAFIYGRSNNPLNYDKFGIERIRKKMVSSKTPIRAIIPAMGGKLTITREGKKIIINYPKELFKFLRTIPTFLKMHKFDAVGKQFEDAYKRNVKDHLLEHADEDDYVNKPKFEKLRLQYETLLYNLYRKDDKSIAQLERLHISPIDRQHLRSSTGIKKAIQSIEVMT